MNKLGMIRVAAAAPRLKVGNPKYNVEEMLRCAEEARDKGASIILFPELAITGATCGDLFHQEFLYEKNLEGLKVLADSTRGTLQPIIVGLPLKLGNGLYDCAAVIQGGKVRGIVPKMFPSGHREHADSRWFASGLALSENASVTVLGYEVPFGSLLFSDGENGFAFGVEIGDDLMAPIAPGTQLALSGAQILFNPAASHEIVGRSESRRRLVCQSSASRVAGLVYASAGVGESTTDLVYGGDCMIAENGSLLARGPRFSRESQILFGEIDYTNLQRERSYASEFAVCAAAYCCPERIRRIELQPLPVLDGNRDRLMRTFKQNPFVCDDPREFARRCQEIFTIQSNALARRLEHSHSRTAVVGISGGLDSTLALLVTARTFQMLGRDPGDIITVTMPGFGTTDQTYNNALTIMRTLGTTMKEISIVPSVTQHFKDIDHDMADHDVTYENAQARERTQILMDIANQNGGLVVGTGDLSEVALGWSTYNGDHMSMYGVNCGVPKTLVRFVIRWLMDNRLSGPEEDPSFSSDNALLKQALQDIMNTPISPELLPPDENGQIAQKTEEKVGPYILHDFFVYHTIRWGTAPKKLLFLAKEAFRDEYDEDYIKKWLIVFYRRFFTQQFKRSCVPDGPKVGSVGLSPRGDWAMPSDADVSLWLAELE
ncbi:MAG: NAD(+) synthase [Firmicutes bacterium]|nr:NAD(+) synthase [Bacillota bacterium]